MLAPDSRVPLLGRHQDGRQPTEGNGENGEYPHGREQAQERAGAD